MSLGRIVPNGNAWIEGITGQEAPGAVACLTAASALGGLTKIEDIHPIVRFPVSDGHWIRGQTIFANGGFMTR